MPWECKACSLWVEVDHQQCPQCGQTKQSWTVVQDLSRVLVVPTSRARLAALRGRRVESAEGHHGVAWQPTQEASVLTREAARALRAKGLLPDPRDLLCVRMVPKAQRGWSLTIEVMFESRKVQEVEYAFSPAPDRLGDEPAGAFDALFLCVRGPGDRSGLDFPRVHVLEVGEETDLGHAPRLVLSSVKGNKVSVNLVAVPGDKVAHVLELEDVNFHFDSAVLLPDRLQDEEPGAPSSQAAEQDRVQGLAAVALLLRFIERHPEKQVLVAGHTDTSGGDAYNVLLSEQRAGNVLHYLRGERQAWAASAQAKHQVRDWQAVLTWAAREKGWACDPQGVDGVWGPNSEQARRTFRDEYNRERGASLPLWGPSSVADWQAVYDLYDEELAEQLEVDAAGLAAHRGRLRWVEPGKLGCGEHWPLESPGLDGLKSQTNRRVELLCFDAGEVPDLPGAPPGETIYGQGRYRFVYITLADEPKPAPFLFSA